MSDPPGISAYAMGAGSGSIQGGDALEELMTSGLSTTDDVGELRPVLADAVPTIENGMWRVLPDGRMETTWRLRPGVVWHDGTPFTAADLVFTARLGQDRDLTLFRHSGFDLLEEVRVGDDRTVIATWKQPYLQADALFTRRFGLPRPRHVLESAYDENKESVTQHSYWTEGFVGTGPFRLRAWAPGSHAILEANDRFVAGRPRIDEIEIRFIPDENTIMANLIAGRVELTLGRTLLVHEAAQIRDRWEGQIHVGVRSWVILWPQLLNPGTPSLHSVAFRKALVHAIDRQQIADTLEHGLVPVAHSFLSPTEAVYPAVASQIVRYDYDPRRAGQLIESLGYTRGPGGLYQDGTGQLLALEARTSADHDERILAVSNYLREAGIAAEPFIIPNARRSDREYDATFPGLRLERQPNDSRGVFRYHSREARLPENRFNGGNRSRYMNPELDALIDRYMTTLAAGERAPVLGSILHHMTDQVTVIGVHYNAEPVIVASRLEGVKPRGAGESTEAWNAHEWNVRS
jgi:peptide/nickel transport system substrate-binding protein